MSDLEWLCEEVARAFDAPIVWIGLLQDEHEDVVASFGTKTRRVSLGSSLAARIAGERDVVVVPDVTRDPRFASHPLVGTTSGIRFYAGAPIFDGNGDYAGAVSVADRMTRTADLRHVALLRLAARHVGNDLADREELLEAADRFRDFFEQTGDLIVSIAPDGRLIHANSTAVAMLGISRGTPLEAAAAPDRGDELREAIERVFTRGTVERIETAFLTTAGTEITLEGSLVPKIIDGRPALARAILRDVTDRKQFEAELGASRDAALEAARVKTRFLANVSHEIRTPMNGITGMIDLLLATKLDAEQADFAHQARASAEQLLAIVNNILYISNLEGGSLEASQVDFDLNRAMQRIVDVIRVEALGKDLEVSFFLDPALPVVCRGNRAKVQQVVTNLLENAVKFTREGSVSLRVTLQAETDTHHVVRFEVRDTGIGIAEEDRLLLFERFLQLDDASTRRFSGVGLGLATARHLVETLGGVIDVESEPGRGSTFWFTVSFPKPPAGRRPIASADLDLKGMRVLVLEPGASNRRVLLHYLESAWEMRADAVASGEEALRLLRAASDPYRLLVFATPDDIGPLELARAIHDDPALGSTGLVLLVNAGRAPDAEAVRAAGVHACATLPVGQHELFDAIAIAVARNAVGLSRPAHGAPASAAVAPPPPLGPEERRGIRILLAEDNFLNMKLTMSQLQKLGFQADPVQNGREALEALARREYDIVLMDCQMPVVDGYEATTEIRRRESLLGPRHHIIAMTANALEGDREKCLAAGMDDYLSKPTRHEEIERAIGQWHARRGRSRGVCAPG